MKVKKYIKEVKVTEVILDKPDVEFLKSLGLDEQYLLDGEIGTITVGDNEKRIYKINL